MNEIAETGPTSFFRESLIYVGRAKQFDRQDWIVYVAWIGLMSGLFFSVGGFF